VEHAFRFTKKIAPPFERANDKIRATAQRDHPRDTLLKISLLAWHRCRQRETFQSRVIFHYRGRGGKLSETRKQSLEPFREQSPPFNPIRSVQAETSRSFVHIIALARSPIVERNETRRRVERAVRQSNELFTNHSRIREPRND